MILRLHLKRRNPKRDPISNKKTTTNQQKLRKKASRCDIKASIIGVGILHYLILHLSHGQTFNLCPSVCL